MKKALLRADKPAKRHWRRTLLLTWGLLGLWLVVTLLTGFLPDVLNERHFLGFPFGYYMAAQGALLVYLAIIGVHTWIMNRLDQDYEAEASNYDRLPGPSQGTN